MLAIITNGLAQESEKLKIDLILDSWHAAAAAADFEGYFSLMTENGVFLGTDATENWQREAFMTFSKPYFERGKAWHFKAVERNVYVNEGADFAGYDELLNTQMKLSRGSGVLQKVNNEWRIAHYVLSIAVPNEHVGELVEIKKQKDSLLLITLKKGYGKE